METFEIVRRRLFQALDEAELNAPPLCIGAENPVERGRRALVAYRSRKLPPEPVHITAADWIAATVGSLAQAHSAGVEQIDPAQLDRVMRRLLAEADDVVRVGAPHDVRDTRRIRHRGSTNGVHPSPSHAGRSHHRRAA